MKLSSKWYEFAYDDIDSAKIMLKEGKNNNVCFFSHQSVEKAFKGFLVENNINPPRTHNLIDLCNLCIEINPDFKQFLPAARILNQFYIPTRYPIAPMGSTSKGMPGREIAEEALDKATNIVDYFVNLERAK